MYFNLALKNVKKSYKDYFVYFITLTISVALFYVFNSFESLQDILVADQDVIFAFRTLTMAMGVLSYFVTFVFGFLILYANNFIMKRRKKEIALYTLLGMKKSRVSRIMLYETFIVGLVSLGSGIFLGIILSQGVAAFIGHLLQVTIQYRLVISGTAVTSTLINFSIIFVIVGVFNNILMSQTKLIDLFKARQTSEVVVVKHPFIMLLIMIVSLSVLGYTYYFVLQPMNLIKYLFQVLIVGSLSTFGLFYSLSYFFVRISQRLKSYYYRDLNAFTTRQISSKIGSTYKLLASVSLMLLLSFGSLATAFNVNSIINNMFNKETTYDVNIELYDLNTESRNVSDLLNLNPSYEVQEFEVYQTNYLTMSMNSNDFHRINGSTMLDEYHLGLDLVDVDAYNYYIQRENREPVSLSDNEVIYFLDTSYFVGENVSEKLFNDTFTVAGVPLHAIKHTDNHTLFGMVQGVSNIIIVSNKTTLERLKAATAVALEEDMTGAIRHAVNINFKEGQDAKEEIEIIKESLDAVMSEDNNAFEFYNYSSKENDMAEARQMTLLLTFIGLYLGLTFIVVCVMVISLQLLSEATDNFERYLLLDKIGVSSKLQKRSIFKQNLIYFSIPLVIALIHSVIGLKAVNETMALQGLQTQSYTANVIGISILVGIYLIYFIVTYMSSARMIFDRK